MPFTDEKALALIAEVDGLSLNVATKQALYTVITGKKLVPVMVVIEDASTDLSTADLSVGGNANADDWVKDAQLDNVDAAGKCAILQPDPGEGATPTPGGFPIYNAGDVFGLKVGTTVVGTANVKVFGYLV